MRKLSTYLADNKPHRKHSRIGLTCPQREPRKPSSCVGLERVPISPPPPSEPPRRALLRATGATVFRRARPFVRQTMLERHPHYNTSGIPGHDFCIRIACD